MKRQLAFLLILSLSIAVLSACGSQTANLVETDPPPTESEAEETVVVETPAEETESARELTWGWLLLPENDYAVYYDLDYKLRFSLPLSVQITYPLTLEPANYSAETAAQLPAGSAQTPIAEGAGRSLTMTFEYEGDEALSNELVINMLPGGSGNRLHEPDARLTEEEHFDFVTDSGDTGDKWVWEIDGRTYVELSLDMTGSLASTVNLYCDFSSAAYAEYQQTLEEIFVSAAVIPDDTLEACRALSQKGGQ